MEKQIEDFFREIGYPLELIVQKRPSKCTEESVLKAVETVYDHMYCYGVDEFIRIPRRIWHLAATYKPRDFTHEHDIKLGVQYWKGKYEYQKNLTYEIIGLGVGVLWFVTSIVWMVAKQ